MLTFSLDTGIFSVPSLKRLTPSFQDKAAKLTTWFDRELDGTGKGTVEGQ